MEKEHKESYFNHDADIGVIGVGQEITDAFISGAQAIFALMSDPEEIRQTHRVTFQFEESDVELAFVEWLNLLIAHARKNKLIFKSFELSRDHDCWQGVAMGEPWQEKFTRGTEVKGATLTELSVKKIDNLWEARCVVDV